ncbi:PorT family protein [Hymenobacter setariae]|uniref:PorT family protein n=1 Tax=Hymenobacter setariae TaxID=2594794 RepID=A0A558BVQ8_9BACT|nr:PorT family protein [Hymenobacter setariae]
MLLHKLCLIALAVGSAPLASVAQTPTASTRYYVGLGGSLLSDFRSGSSRFPALSLTAGRQLKPRVALQTGVTVGWRSYSYGYSYVNSGQTIPTFYESGTRTTFITVPVLLRYTLSQSVNRLQVDALVGLSLIASINRGTSTVTYNNQTQYSDSYRNSGFRGTLVAGPALRYGLTPRVALMAEIPVNFVIGDFGGRLSDQFFYNLQVGGRYNFG